MAYERLRTGSPAIGQPEMKRVQWRTFYWKKRDDWQSSAKRGNIRKSQPVWKRPKTIPRMRHEVGGAWKPIVGRGSTGGGERIMGEEDTRRNWPQTLVNGSIEGVRRGMLEVSWSWGGGEVRSEDARR